MINFVHSCEKGFVLGVMKVLKEGKSKELPETVCYIWEISSILVRLGHRM